VAVRQLPEADAPELERVLITTHRYHARVAEWQTRTTQNRVRKLMRVRLSPRALKLGVLVQKVNLGDPDYTLFISKTAYETIVSR
jgi:hypothetical protein